MPDLSQVPQCKRPVVEVPELVQNARDVLAGQGFSVADILKLLPPDSSASQATQGKCVALKGSYSGRQAIRLVP